jgi:amidase
MKFVGSHHWHTHIDRSRPPALAAEPGELVVIETRDACYGRVRTTADFEVYRNDPNRQPDPLTGPIVVRGARAGGGLLVEIVDVKLDDEGFQLIGPNRAIIRDEVTEWNCFGVHIRDGAIELPRGLRLPVDPVIGTLGTAPAGAPTLQPNRLGGNLDCPQIKVGARVYLPVEVEGAYFYLGDVHARQGDGEVVGAPEIGAKVTVRFSLLDEPLAAWPVIEDQTHWRMVTAAATEGEAIRSGVFELAGFIERKYGVSLNDALVLLTMCVSLNCSRTGGWGDLQSVICASFPKELVERATSGVREPHSR